jgi:uncharacterized OsmC-like protein
MMSVPPGLDPSIRHRVVTIEAQTENVHKMHHRATVGRFEFHSDEPPVMDGDDEYPTPLDYLAAAIGF